MYSFPNLIGQEKPYPLKFILILFHKNNNFNPPYPKSHIQAVEMPNPPATYANNAYLRHEAKFNKFGKKIKSTVPAVADDFGALSGSNYSYFFEEEPDLNLILLL
jgi:hypothetical protein